MITKEEILELFRQPDPVSSGEFTSVEFAKKLGCVKNTANIIIKRMFNDGLVEIAGVKMIHRIDGQKNPSPVYRFTEEFHKKLRAEKRKKK